MKDLFRIPNHAERAISLLASQFSESPRLQALIRVFCTQIQELQNVAESLYDMRSLNTAVGVNLDLIGQILNLPRQAGESDEHYRERLRFRSFVFFSSGTPEQLMEILRVNSEATFVKYDDMFPAGYQMFTDGGADFPDNSTLTPDQQLNHNFISEILLRASPAAVQFVPVTASYGVPLVFGFAPDILDNPLVVNTETQTDAPLLIQPTDYQLYVNSGQSDDVIAEGGYADISDYAILGLDNNGILELDDGGNLLLFVDSSSYDTPGAGQYAELLYYTE